MCLDHSAHGVVSTHEIFRKPYQVALEWETIPTPENYRRFWNGRKLGPTIKTWRVQTTGYVKDKSMRPGVVAGGWGFSDAPDGEFIAGGLNTKGPKYVALGRHGPFFQWGFSAPPSKMTPSGRRTFVNAICYIAKFDRQQPLTRKKRHSLARGYVLDHAMMLSNLKEHHEKLVANHAKRAAARDRAEEIQRSKSRPLTKEEEWALRFPKVDPMSWERYQKLVLRSFPPELVERFGTDPEGLKKYLPYYKENIEYLTRVRSTFVVDEDAKVLGISNRDPAILDKAVQLLESGDDKARGLRLLRLYTDQRFEKPTEWHGWLKRERGNLFFSDVGGYRFYSSRR